MPAETSGKSIQYVSIYTGKKHGPENLPPVRDIEKILRERLGVETGHLGHGGVVEFVWDKNVIRQAELDTALNLIREICPGVGILYGDRSRVTM